MMQHPEVGRRRAVHALIFTAVVSRHMFVWLSFTQTLADVVKGCEAAWRFFRGAFKVLVPDNMKPVVTGRRSAQPDVQRRLAGLRPGRFRTRREGPARRRTRRVLSGWCSTCAAMS